MSVNPHSNSAENIGHERRDVSVSAVTVFIIVLELFMLACCGLCLIFQKGYLHWARSSNATISAMAVYVQEPPAPRLQVDPTADLEEYRNAENSLNTSYGWVDPHAGVVRLPIERAKALIAERGLPARASVQESKL